MFGLIFINMDFNFIFHLEQYINKTELHNNITSSTTCFEYNVVKTLRSVQLIDVSLLHMQKDSHIVSMIQKVFVKDNVMSKHSCMAL